MTYYATLKNTFPVSMRRKDETERFLRKNDEFETKILMVPLQNNRAFKHAMVTYIIKPIESNKYNYEHSLIS